jgi:hypothetical protein
MKWSLNRIIRALPALAALWLVAIAAHPALAIHRYTFHQLLHSGYGGKALGVALGDTNGDGKVDITDLTVVSGFTNDFAGHRSAALWRSDGSGGFSLTQLPGIGGVESIANAPATGEDGTANAVGAAKNSVGTWKPLLWREKADVTGLFVTFELPTLGGAGGVALDQRGCVYPICGGWIVGRTDTASGDHHATLWRETTPSVFAAVDLGTLGGNFSEATSVQASDDWWEHINIVGRSTNAAGQMRACFWTSNDDGLTWTIHDRHPAGAAASMLNGVSGDGGNFFSVGTAVSSQGRRLGYVSNRIGEQWNQLLASAPGYKNTDLTDALRTRFGGTFIGSVWDDTDIVHAMLGAYLTQPIAGSNLRFYSPAAVIDPSRFDEARFRLAAIEPGGIAGSHLEGEMESPMILIATGDVLGHIRLIQGKPEAQFGDPDLWHANDGRTLKVSTAKHLNATTLEISFYEDENGDGDLEDNGERIFSVRARAYSRIGPDIHDNIVQHEVFNFQTGEYESVGEPLALGSSNDFEVWNQPVGLSHANPLTGEVRVRIRFLGSHLKGVEIDQAILRPMP